MSYPCPYTALGEVKYHTLTMEADGVLRVSFNNGKVNSWIEPMWREFDRIFRFIKTDGNVSAIVLSGNNRCFTAGLDCEITSSVFDVMLFAVCSLLFALY
jgi:delta(3,5)-delta(2,4)-dienoyl-CoA isomerase